MSSGPNSRATSRPNASMSLSARTSSLCRLPRNPCSLLGSRSVAINFAPSTANFSAMARPIPWAAAVTRATLPLSRSVILASRFFQRSVRVQPGKADLLPAVLVKILRLKPALEASLPHRPFAVDDRIPGVVAVAPLRDHVLPKDSLIDKSVAQSRAARGRVQCIAFPLVAAVAEVFENVARQKVLSFGAERGALERGRIENMADLDHSHVRYDAQQREKADGAIRQINDRVGIGIFARRAHRNI